MPYSDPHRVGYRNTDTSAAAAARIGSKAATIREQVVDCLKASPAPLTTDEIAFRIGRPYCSVQPRLSELRRSGRVEDSGERKTGYWGVNNIAWRLAKREGEAS